MVNNVNSTANQTYSSAKSKKTDELNGKDYKKVAEELQDKTSKTEDKKPDDVNNAQSTPENEDADQKKKEEEAARRVDGLFEEEQLKFLDSIKDDPENKRLVDNQQLGKDQFMHILLKQLANQNPLDPMQDKDFIAQMAQFSSLESTKNMADKFEGLAENVEAIKAGLQAPSKVDVEYITYLKELHKHMKAITNKLGIEFDENGDVIQKPDDSGVSEPVDGADKTEAIGNDENVEGTQNSGIADNGTSDNSATPSEEVNKEIAKNNAKKAYKV